MVQGVSYLGFLSSTYLYMRVYTREESTARSANDTCMSAACLVCTSRAEQHFLMEHVTSFNISKEGMTTRKCLCWSCRPPRKCRLWTGWNQINIIKLGSCDGPMAMKFSDMIRAAPCGVFSRMSHLSIVARLHEGPNTIFLKKSIDEVVNTTRLFSVVAGSRFCLYCMGQRTALPLAAWCKIKITNNVLRGVAFIYVRLATTGGGWRFV